MSKQSDLINLTDAITVDGSNNVGIGTSSPTSQLDLYNATTAKMTVRSGDGSAASVKLVRVAENDTSTDYEVKNAGGTFKIIGDNTSQNEFSCLDIETLTTKFYTNNTERLRIDSEGIIRLGDLNEKLGNGTNFFSCSGNGYATLRVRRGADSGPCALFYGYGSSSTQVGRIDVTNTSTSYITSSDYRLKENITPLNGAADRLAQIPVHRFNFIADPDTTVDGFLAHEVQAFVPEAITGEKDGLDADGNPDYQGIDQSKLVPLLTAALQEALQKIDALEARVAALEAV